MDTVALTAYAGSERELSCGFREVSAVERRIDQQARFHRLFVLVIVPKTGCAEHDRQEVPVC